MVSYGWLWLVIILYIILDTGLKPPRVAVHLSGPITKLWVRLDGLRQSPCTTYVLP